MTANPIVPKLGYFLFLFGALAGLFFNGLATWADFEAANYNAVFSSDTTLPSLHCPVILSPQEAGTIRASFNNPTGQKLIRRIRIYLSRERASDMQEEFVVVSLAPDERKSLAWTVGSENLVWNRLILARVYQNRNHPLPSRSSACGVIVANVAGLPGSYVTGLAIVGSPLLMLAGMLLRIHNNRPNPGMTRPSSNRELTMKTMATVITVGLLTTFLSQWMLGAILVVITTLLVVSVLAHTLQS